MADAWQVFSSTALSHLGDAHSWVRQITGIGNGSAWCAAFVCACAKVAGVSNVIIPNQFACHNLAKTGVDKKMGMWFDGPYRGSNHTPSPGDLILFRFNPKKVRWGNDRYESDHIGIITDVRNGIIYTAEGNRTISGTKGRAGTFQYKINHASITGYFRPYWNKVGANIRGVSYDPSYANSGGVLGSFTVDIIPEKSRRDAIARELCFVNSTYQPSIQTSTIRLSAVDFWSPIGPLITVPYGSSSSDLSGLDSKPREIVSFLEQQGLPTAAGIGIIANIKHESNFNLGAVGDNGTSVGLCQWHKDRKSAMIAFVGSDWANNLTGQLNYLMKELNEGKYCNKGLLNSLRSVPNTQSGAMQSAELFVRQFERPKDIEGAVRRRQATAVQYWSNVVVQQTGPTYTSTANGREVIIPTSVLQSGICGNYTNYTYFFPKWSKGTNQRKVADMWHDKGRQSDRGIATISGYYLVAVTPIFGKVGDSIAVVLENGASFNAIIADLKGNDARSQWGHDMGGGKLDIIEWERVGSPNKNNVVNAINLSGWQGQRVIKIINRGSVL